MQYPRGQQVGTHHVFRPGGVAGADGDQHLAVVLHAALERRAVVAGEIASDDRGTHHALEDLGQTLGYYGVGAGPYLVLPFFGPSSLRDSIGLAGDQGLFYAIDPLQLDEHPWARLPYWTLYVINTRDTVNFRYYQTGSPFEYTLVRLVYMNYRALQVEQ